MTEQIPTVDVHAHVLLEPLERLVSDEPGLAGALELDRRRFGQRALEVSRSSVTERMALLVDPAARIAEMDRTGVGVQVVSVSPTQYHSWAGEELARELAMTTNELIAAHCATSPSRLTGLGVAPIQHPQLAAEALQDAVVNHDLRGVEITSHATDIAGDAIDLSDRRLDTLWERAVQLGAVIFIHPWGCTLDARLDNWYMGNVVGQPVEHAVALSHLILSGVFDRFPTLKIIAGHGGGYLPTCLSRADFAWEHRSDVDGCKRRPSDYLHQIWFDSLVYTPGALRQLVDAVGASQVVLGTDYPFDMGVDDCLRRLDEAGFDTTTTEAIRRRNATQLGLLPRSGPRPTN